MSFFSLHLLLVLSVCISRRIPDAIAQRRQTRTLDNTRNTLGFCSFTRVCVCSNIFERVASVMPVTIAIKNAIFFPDSYTVFIDRLKLLFSRGYFSVCNIARTDELLLKKTNSKRCGPDPRLEVYCNLFVFFIYINQKFITLSEFVGREKKTAVAEN